ncbi:DNA-binding transcriptional ArsR family regulator [Fontibacillus phaseoli]|uniref:DNA-binding transcriptional ArsR family regulator n=1 Tax=Fontibacillus phaseoli TaxID=1416533 RepID=A0A369BE29_9BACL|nr:winged helix-turn-helix domain-containing protein [Fontibacillus phaseoli]RCX19809.1 DNA-binding transcriptional ArsR family regulator [Fontibacillus phaseoli]
MSYNIEADFAPIYECVTSITAFISKQNHNAMDAGKLWVREVQDLFAPVIMQKMREAIKKLEDFSLSPYIWSCPGNRSVPEFLDWFDALSTGQLYEIAAGFGQTVPSNLSELRNLTSEVLREWNLRYFGSISPAITEGLAQEAESLKSRLKETNSLEVYEQATGGMRIYPNELLKRFVLIPQYHSRPLVTSSIFDETIFTHYSCDIIPPAPGHPAPGLLRLTRALSDETRLCILRLLSEKQMTFTEIVREIGLSKSTIHYHLISLRAAGLVIVHYYLKNNDNKNVEYNLRLEALNDLPLQIGQFLKK